MSLRSPHHSMPLRPASVTQHPQPTSRELQKRLRIADLGHDTVPGRSAREWFAHLRPILLASRPILNPGETRRIQVTARTGRVMNRTVPVDPVYGKPTFRNVIEDGELR